MTAFVLHGITRIIIALGAITFGYLGYRLFIHGHTQGKGSLEFESRVAKVIFSGTGPGLFFMAFGAIILSLLVLRGTVDQVVTTEEAKPATSESGGEQILMRRRE